MSKRSRETSFSPSAADELSTAEDQQDDSDTDAHRSSKYKQVDGLASAPETTVMRCSLPPHQTALTFQSQEKYEVHYLKEHTNRCASCGKNFPTAHVLGLHIEENHDALRETRQAKGEKTYACLVEDCDRYCSTPQKRRLHLIDKHGFPRSYNFRVVDYGIDKATSLLKEGQRRRVSLSSDPGQSSGHRRRASSLAQASAQDAENASIPERPGTDVTARTSPDPHHRRNVISKGSKAALPSTSGTSRKTAASAPSEIEDLEKSMSALRFVPTSVVLRNSKKS